MLYPHNRAAMHSLERPPTPASVHLTGRSWIQEDASLLLSHSTSQTSPVSVSVSDPKQLTWESNACRDCGEC